MTVSTEGLAAAVKGRVVARGDAGYDEARALYNAMIDKRPAAIAYCMDAGDVAAAVHFANDRGLRIAVRSGGHNGGGLGSVDAFASAFPAGTLSGAWWAPIVLVAGAVIAFVTTTLGREHDVLHGHPAS